MIFFLTDESYPTVEVQFRGVSLLKSTETESVYLVSS